MKRLFLLAALTLSLVAAQKPKSEKPARPDLSEQEQDDLSTALAEAGSSPIEFLRALEKHLARYPNSQRKPELERAAVRAAIEAKDERRIVLYGERVLAQDPDDLQILERVTRALLAANAKDASERALQHAARFEKALAALRQEGDTSHMGRAGLQEEIDRGLGRAYVFEARAHANLDHLEPALAFSRRSWDTWATAEAAREVARCYERLNRPADAIAYLARAFTIADPRNTDSDRARDRAKMGELWRQSKPDEAGLGDLILKAWDETTELIHQRQLRAREADPNSAAAAPLDFTVSSPDGKKLALSTLKGKTVVFDFWATWCGPCRGQHPLYEQVKQRFRDNPNVVFLSISTDEDREAVQPFIEEMKWKGPVWFDDGMARVLRIASIPTTLIVDKRGEVFSRMNGFVPERFVDMLTERIRDALAN